MLIEQTLHHLSTLKLIGMKGALQRQLEQPNTHHLSFEERLGLLVDQERAYRQDKKINRLLAAAKLRQQACMEDIDYRHARGIRREEISSLASCQWIKEGVNIFITGPTGIGKSWLACALGHQACRLGLSVSYVRISRLFEEIRLAHADGSYPKIASKLLKYDLLILDDWGLERLTQEQRRDLLEIIEDRHTIKPLLITSQLPVAKWHEVIGDPTIADAILDRLLHKSLKYELIGESMRHLQKAVAA
jgi:DNA replication protein DnaC